MAMFNSYVKLAEGNSCKFDGWVSGFNGGLNGGYTNNSG